MLFRIGQSKISDGEASADVKPGQTARHQLVGLPIHANLTSYSLSEMEPIHMSMVLTYDHISDSWASRYLINLSPISCGGAEGMSGDK